MNLLGSGEKKQKLLAVYMTMSEILPPNRSFIDPMQLVMLCRQSDYQFIGQEEVPPSFVKYLKDIEQSGITSETGETVKGVVIAIVGDNLAIRLTYRLVSVTNSFFSLLLQGRRHQYPVQDQEYSSG